VEVSPLKSLTLFFPFLKKEARRTIEFFRALVLPLTNLSSTKFVQEVIQEKQNISVVPFLRGFNYFGMEIIPCIDSEGLQTRDDVTSN
jgi:hypothetical protein